MYSFGYGADSHQPHGDHYEVSQHVMGGGDYAVMCRITYGQSLTRDEDGVKQIVYTLSIGLTQEQAEQLMQISKDTREDSEKGLREVAEKMEKVRVALGEEPGVGNNKIAPNTVEVFMVKIPAPLESVTINVVEPPKEEPTVDVTKLPKF